MTEQEWIACDDVRRMLIFLRGDTALRDTSVPDHRARSTSSFGTLVAGEAHLVGQRPLAMFARHISDGWRDLPLDGGCRGLLDCYQRFLEGNETSAALRVEWQREYDKQRASSSFWGGILVCDILEWSGTPFGVHSLAQRMASATTCYVHRERIAELERNATEDELFGWGFLGHEFPEYWETVRQVYRPFPNLLREVVGPYPFRRVTLNPAWLTSNVVALAQVIYEQRAFSAMPILADALQDADCDHQDILTHLRDPNATHVRGCWALDLVLCVTKRG